jgi:hypothetical protein
MSPELEAVMDALARPAVYAGVAPPAFAPPEVQREWSATAVLNALAALKTRQDA